MNTLNVERSKVSLIALFFSVLVYFPTVASAGSSDYHLVEMSDDFSKHKDVFANAARKLIDAGQCTEADFMEVGGWLKSMNHKSQPIYFTYCGGMTIPNRIYLNVKTRETYK